MEPKAAPPAPIDNAYWVEPTRLLAGEYPGRRDEDATRERVSRLLEAGIDCFIDLTEPGELAPYEQFLPGPYGRDAVLYVRKPIRDHGLPRDPGQMLEILDELDAALGEGRRVYLHCRAGIGRTNLVAGCWLARRGYLGEAALERLNALWQASSRAGAWPCVPETAEQEDYVRGWREEAPGELRGVPGAEPGGLRGRLRGMLLGLAAGDAAGQSLARRPPGSFTPVGDLLGGGPFDLPRGAWTDETAMALCLAESLVARGGVDLSDQVARYALWQRDGLGSSTGQCIGISAATARALAQAQWTGQPRAGSHDPARADKEPLARIGPAVAFHAQDPREAIEAAVECARVTHQAPVTLDAVRYFAALLAGALQGASRAELLRPLFSPVGGLWDARPLKPEVLAVAKGSWRDKAPPRIFGGGQAPAALEATLWAFERGSSLRESLLAAVNLGGDADTTGAITGQLAGACHGAEALPAAWQAALAGRERIVSLADALLAAALQRGPPR
ncbi:MAG: ADP-ribosylglycohydrolase family protein [Steroidobacteraceae bacterium]|jgi:ADP-ribosylglycohydrolase|nr:ADP-ribosylglycohydrolase family protein [Steroidobacteraceae bacterium]